MFQNITKNIKISLIVLLLRLSICVKFKQKSLTGSKIT